MKRLRTLDGALRPTVDPSWIFTEDGCDRLRESNRDTRFAISNGHLGVRGVLAVNFANNRLSPPKTYVAGLFDTPDADGSVPGLVSAPDWLQLSLSGPVGPLRHCAVAGSSHPLTLDMRRGLLLTECRELGAPDGRILLRTLRLVSLGRRALGLQIVQLQTEEGDFELTLNAGFAATSPNLLPEQFSEDVGVWRTKYSGKRLAMAVATSLQVGDRDVAPTTLGQFSRSWTWSTRAGQVACFRRLVAITRSDVEDARPGADAEEELGVARRLGWRGVLAEHEAAWASRWRSSDVEVQGDPAAQQALRFAVYHLNSAANPADNHVSIGARALTGDDYLGHVFWDTEIFLLPFYILTWPEAARALLMYRFGTLDAARRKAAAQGWRGALYAWESTDSGVETTPSQVVAPDRRVVDVVSGEQEHHISADVAYAVWQYWLASGDEQFLLDAGAEILLETARFWSSRAHLEADGLGHIRSVVGPDEYHERIDDNAFTNVMARWNILRALDITAVLQTRWPQRWVDLSGRLCLDDKELMQWRVDADALFTGLDVRTGLFEQFAGFFTLEEVDLAAYNGRSVPMDIVLGRERTGRSQVVKQADVVALLALLPDEFVGQSGAENFAFYEPRCGHGSSLSRPMHGLAAARLGQSEVALSYFRQTAAIDLADTHVAIAGGVHIGAQGGLWLMTVFGFAGLSLRSDHLSVDPRLPASWRSLGFHIHWRGRRLKILMDQDRQILEATLEAGGPMILEVGGELHDLDGDKALRVAIDAPLAR